MNFKKSKRIICSGGFLAFAWGVVLCSAVLLSGFSYAKKPAGRGAVGGAGAVRMNSARAAKMKVRLAGVLEQRRRKSGLSRSQLGIVVGDSEGIIYALNKKKRFIPASLAKIWTAGALLDLLPPAKRFYTRFLMEKSKQSPPSALNPPPPLEVKKHPPSPIPSAPFKAKAPPSSRFIYPPLPLGGGEGGVGFTLNGPLYLKGGGDPSFVSESLWNLVNNLTRTGLKRVKGDLLVDDSLFQKPFKAKGGRFDKSLPQQSGALPPYEAPAGALSFNWNAVNLYVRPGVKAGGRARVAAGPSSLYFSSIKNNVVSVGGQKGKGLSVDIIERAGGLKNILKLSGEVSSSVSLGSRERLFYRSISHPALWTGANAVFFLKNRGIVIEGRVRRGKVPSKAVVLAEWPGKTLSQNIRLMMKYSNNYMANMLVQGLSAELSGEGGSIKKGLKILKKYMKNQFGVSSKEYRLFQPSGLGRGNRIQPRHLWKVLKYWQQHPLQPEFESALPLAGLDGTLRRRFIMPGLTGRMHAKTGRLSGVSGLAGYVNAASGKKYTFVFMFNGPAKKQAQAETLFAVLAQTISTY